MDYVRIAGLNILRYTGNPGWIPKTELILSPTTQSNLRKILPPLSYGHNLLLIGDAGVGKNALLYYINSLRSCPTIRYSFNEDTLPEDLVGAYRIDQGSKSFIWSDGPLIQAMRKGASFIADEMNLTGPEILKRFTSVFTDGYLQLLEGDSSTVKAQTGFTFIATQNPAEGFEGRKNLPREIRKYFTTIYIDPYSEEELVTILEGLYPELDQHLIHTIVRTNQKIEQLLMHHKIGANDLERYHFNLRNLKRLGERLRSHDSLDWQKDIDDIYIRPFRKPEDMKLIKHTIEENLGIESIAEPRVINIYADSKTKKIHIGRASLDFLGQYNDNKNINFTEAVEQAYALFPPLPQTLAALEAIARAIQQKENILLESMADVEPEDYVRFFSCLLGRRLQIINLSRGMHTADILGGLKPIVSSTESGSLTWIDGPLTAAVRAGDFILIRGLEAAGPELTEKLNMLLDDARALVLPPESGQKDPLLLHDHARIFALKFFRNQKSTPSISRAFRNRFSSIILESITDKESLLELTAHFLQVDTQVNEHREVLEAMVTFHCLIKEQTSQRKIGSANLSIYEFGLTNLRRWCSFISQQQKENIGQQEQNQYKNLIYESAQLAYTNEISDREERQKVLNILDHLLDGLSVEKLIQALDIEESKKKMIRQSTLKRRIWWDQEKHRREANTGKFKAKTYGRKLKKGIRINTPETGGKIKEGPDAWYGSDTQGNKGQGEPGSGGGAWGYRTEELYEEFIRKRRHLWSYDIDVSLEEFHSIFGSELQKIVLDFDHLLDPNPKIDRLYERQGSRVDIRRYLSYAEGKGDGRIFDKTTISVEDNRLKGIELVFLLNKGRRIFNFQYSIATLVSLMSVALLFKEHHVPFGVVGYSDLSNLKETANVIWYKKISQGCNLKQEKELFTGIAREWHGDTVQEGPILKKLATAFSPEARTKVLVMISDFRGFRAKASPNQELASHELKELKQTVDILGRQGVLTLGVGLGPRSLADALFVNHLSIGAENFSHLPTMMTTTLTELLHRHHIT